MRLPLSVIVITHNEEDRIAACLRDLRPIAAEIILIDQESEDATIALGAPYADLVLTDTCSGLAETSHPLGEKTAAYEWQLRLDADECLSNDFKDALPLLLEWSVDGFFLQRIDRIDGKTVNITNQYRLYRRGKILHVDAIHCGPTPYNAVVETLARPCILHDKTRAEQLVDDERYALLEASDPKHRRHRR